MITGLLRSKCETRSRERPERLRIQNLSPLSRRGRAFSFVRKAYKPLRLRPCLSDLRCLLCRFHFGPSSTLRDCHPLAGCCGNRSLRCGGSISALIIARPHFRPTRSLHHPIQTEVSDGYVKQHAFWKVSRPSWLVVGSNLCGWGNRCRLADTRLPEAKACHIPNKR
jgi:hypothetical protein